MEPNAIKTRARCCEESRIGAARMLKSLGWLAFTTAVYLVCLFLLKGGVEWSASMRIAVTLVPLLPGSFFVSSLLKSYQAMDELQRRIQVEAMAVALVGTLLVTTGLNILHANGVALKTFPAGLQIGGIYVSLFIFWCVGSIVSPLRYR